MRSGRSQLVDRDIRDDDVAAVVGDMLATTPRAVAAATQRAKNITSAWNASRTPMASHDKPGSPSFVSLGPL